MVLRSVIDERVTCRGISSTDRIFAVVRDLAGSSQTVKIADVIERCVDKGFKPDQVTNSQVFWGLFLCHSSLFYKPKGFSILPQTSGNNTV